MWQNFYENGGWGMHPTSLFGFLLMVASVLYVLRPEPRLARAVTALSAVTLAAGLLGAAVGVCNSMHYIPQVPKADQLQILALGIEESLHNVVLALILIIVSVLVATAGALRARNGQPSAA